MSEESEPPQRRSMREFDYFSITPKKAADIESDDLPDELAERIETQRASQRGLLRALLAALAFLFVAGWFLWGYRELMSYAFGSARVPQALGDVADLTPADYPHNSYVEITGITEHRGMKQEIVLGPVPWREERWYFRLSGSRGVFIEVPPDPERYSIQTEMKVDGRVIDPARATVYQPLLREYQERFHTRPGELRIIQVGVRPGEGRTPFFVVMGIIFALLCLNVWTITRYIKAAQRGVLQ